MGGFELNDAVSIVAADCLLLATSHVAFSRAVGRFLCCTVNAVEHLSLCSLGVGLSFTNLPFAMTSARGLRLALQQALVGFVAFLMQRLPVLGML